MAAKGKGIPEMVQERKEEEKRKLEELKKSTPQHEKKSVTAVRDTIKPPKRPKPSPPKDEGD